MNTIKFDSRNSLVVAHRGLSGIEKENTCSAFVAAGNRSYWGIETDVRRTADGRIVVNHDKTLLRVSGEDVLVEESDLSVLQRVVLFDVDGTHDRADLVPCTLENYISICKKYEKHCVLELKSDFTDAEMEYIVGLFRSYDYLPHVTFIAFGYENLLKLRRIEPTQSAQFLFKVFTDEIIENVKRDKLDVDVYYKALTKEIVDELHAAGIVINCWTVDDKEVGERLAAWGVDQITTNILE